MKAQDLEVHVNGARAHDDEGFALTELLVAIVVFGLIASATVVTLTKSLDLTRSNRLRTVAASLANRQIETARSQDVQAIANGQSTYDMAVDGISYRVEQTAAFVPQSSASSACDAPSGSRLAYKRISVSVTWPNMGGTPPVRSDTLKTLDVSGLDPSKGALAVAVRDRNDRPLSGQVVTLTPGGVTQTTGEDGCAVFTLLPTGTTFTASVNAPGHVGVNGKQLTVSAGQTVAPASISKVAIRYDLASRLTVKYTNEYSGYPAPSGLPVTINGTTALDGEARTFLDCAASGATAGACASGYPRSVGPVFPWPDGYVAWVNGCTGERVGESAPINAPPGGVGNGTVGLGAVDVTVRDPNGRPVTTTVYAVPEGSGCGTGGIKLGSSSGGVLKTALPPGDWTITTNPDAGSGGDDDDDDDDERRSNGAPLSLDQAGRGAVTLVVR